MKLMKIKFPKVSLRAYLIALLIAELVITAYFYAPVIVIMLTSIAITMALIVLLDKKYNK